MKCYFWEDGSIFPGIQVQDRGEGILSIDLGVDLDKGSTPRFLDLYAPNPPDIIHKKGNQYIHDAYPVPVDAPGRNSLELGKPHDKHDGDRRIIVQMSTFTHTHIHTTKPAHGFWCPVKGDAETLLSGVYTSARGQKWLKGVIRLAPGDALRVGVEGRGQGDYALYNYEGEIKSFSWPVFCQTMFSEDTS